MKHMLLMGLGKLAYTPWAAPLATTAVAVAAFITVSIQLFPLPHYLGLTLPVAVAVNVAIVLFQAACLRQVVLKTITYSFLPLVLAGLWFTQTA